MCFFVSITSHITTPKETPFPQRVNTMICTDAKEAPTATWQVVEIGVPRERYPKILRFKMILRSNMIGSSQVASKKDLNKSISSISPHTWGFVGMEGP